MDVVNFSSPFRHVRHRAPPALFNGQRTGAQKKMNSWCKLRLDNGSFKRNLRRCSLCSTRCVGDERHDLFECPKIDEIRAQYADFFESSAGAMRSFVWHKDQQAVCDCITAVIRLAET